MRHAILCAFLFLLPSCAGGPPLQHQIDVMRASGLLTANFLLTAGKIDVQKHQELVHTIQTASDLASLLLALQQINTAVPPPPVAPPPAPATGGAPK